MLGRLFLLFTITTAVELWLLIEIGSLIGLGPTLALIILTGFVGAWLAKREGLRTLARVRDQLGRGEIPGDALLDGLCILIAGAFLVTPGVLTDLAGFSLLLPFARLPIKAAFLRSFENAVAQGGAAGRFTFVKAGPGGAEAIDIATEAPPRERAPALRPDARRPYVSGEVIDVTDS